MHCLAAIDQMRRSKFVLRTESHLEERAARADVHKALAILKRAGVGKPPVKGDELPARRSQPRKRHVRRSAR
jgi:hypothetical protein